MKTIDLANEKQYGPDAWKHKVSNLAPAHKITLLSYDEASHSSDLNEIVEKYNLRVTVEGPHIRHLEPRE